MEISKAELVIAELFFSLYRRGVHPELFHIYARQRFVCEKYEALIWITGSGHVITVSAGKNVVTELISDSGLVLPKAGLVERFRLDEQKKHRCSLNRSLNYFSGLSVENMTEELYLQSYKNLERSARDHGMFVAFPKSAVNGMEPFSYMDFEAHTDKLSIRSFHAYPESSAIIKMQSRILF